jgi:hypothetical protein
MHLMKQTDAVLVLRDHFPIKYALPFSLALAIGGAIALITTVPQVAVLHCRRQTDVPTCDLWRNNRDFRREIEPIAIGTPQQALIQESNTTTYRLAIQGNLGTYPLVIYYSHDLSKLVHQQRQIEQFISEPVQTELIVSNVGWWRLSGEYSALIWFWGYADFLAIAGLAFTLMFILFGHPIYRFDRTRNTLTIERKVFGIPQKKTYPLSAIRSVVLEQSFELDDDHSDDRDSEYRTVFRISIYLNIDKRQRLGPVGYDNHNVKAKEQVVQTLNTFLGLLPP